MEDAEGGVAAVEVEEVVVPANVGLSGDLEVLDNNVVEPEGRSGDQGVPHVEDQWSGEATPKDHGPMTW